MHNTRYIAKFCQRLEIWCRQIPCLPPGVGVGANVFTGTKDEEDFDYHMEIDAIYWMPDVDVVIVFMRSTFDGDYFDHEYLLSTGWELGDVDVFTKYSHTT